jgi:KDO2-lipid IV(A) lauroyltransferase
LKNAPIQHRIEYAFYWPFRRLLGILPVALRRALGRSAGGLFYRLDRQRRLLTHDNLAQALPEIADERRREIARQSFRNLGETMFDSLGGLGYDAAELCSRWHLEQWHYLLEAEERGKGVILLSAHFGNWEVAAAALALSGHDTLLVGRPPDNPHLLSEMVFLRERFGNRHVAKRGVARHLLRELNANGRIGLLVDQRVPPQEAVAASFFGRPALTTPLVARLSLKTGAPVVAIYGIHQPGGRYRIWLAPPVYPEFVTEGNETASDQDAIERLTRRYLEDQEHQIRQMPEQWLWMHRRWDHRFD